MPAKPINTPAESTTNPSVPATTPVEFRSSKTCGPWESVTDSDNNGGTGAATLRTYISEMLTAENLIVMTGLGTSLCVKSGAGNRLAPTMQDLWREAEAIWAPDENEEDRGAEIEKLCKAVHYRAPVEKNDKPAVEKYDFEELMSHCQVALRFNADTAIEKFVKALEARVVERCRFTASAAEFRVHQDFLRRVARRTPRRPRMKLFTTNYDHCFEEASARARFVVVDGFSHAMPQEFDGTYFGYDIVRRETMEGTPDYIENVFHLYKLHGSLDWEKIKDGSGIERIVKNPAATNPIIIYPRDTKFAASYEQPHLEMMSRFQNALRQPKTALLVIGFGFADKHLAGPMLAALRSNIGLKMLIVDPAVKHRIDTAHNDAYAEIGRFADAGDPRLALLTAKFEEFVPHIPDLMAATEEEQFRARYAKAAAQP